MSRRVLVCLAVFVVLSRVAVAADLDGYTLTGVIHDPGRVSVAILEHTDGTFVVVRSGENTELGRVSSIDRHSVIFDRPDQRISMSLEYGVQRFSPDGSRLLASEDTGGAVQPDSAVAHDGESPAITTSYKPAARVVAVRGSAESLSALIESAASRTGFAGLSGSDGGSAAAGASVSTEGDSSGRNGHSGGTANNQAPKELGIKLAEVFDLPQTMEVLRVNADTVESVGESFRYIQSQIEIGNTVTLFTHGIPPSNRIYIQPDSPGG